MWWMFSYGAAFTVYFTLAVVFAEKGRGWSTMLFTLLAVAQVVAATLQYVKDRRAARR